MSRNKLTKTESRYHAEVKNCSDYDFMEVIVSEEEIDKGRMKIKFLDERWRTKDETVNVLEEMIKLVKALK